MGHDQGEVLVAQRRNRRFAPGLVCRPGLPALRTFSAPPRALPAAWLRPPGRSTAARLRYAAHRAHDRGSLFTTVLLCCAAFLYGCTREPPAPVREEVFHPQAEAARVAGDYDAAIAGYLQSIATEPRDPRPYYGLVEAHYRRGDLDAAEPILRSLLARPEVSPQEQACIHYGLACLAVRRQDLDSALGEAEETLGLDPQLGHGQLLLGSVHYYAGRPDEALKAWGAARGIFHRQRDVKYEAWALNRTALVRRELGELRPALAEFREALRFQEALGDSQAQQLVLGNIGLTQADLGDLAGALEAFQQALLFSRRTGDRDGECWGLTNLSYVHNLAGQHHRAIAYADSAIAIAREMGNPVDELTGLITRATASLDLGDPVGALRVTGGALELARSLADPRQETTVLTTRGRAFLSVGRLDQARESYARADSLYREMEIASGSWESRMGLCEVAALQGDTTAAIAIAEETLAGCAQAEYAETEEFVALTLCEMLRRQAGGARPDAALLDRARALADRAVTSSRRDGRRNREAIALARRAQARFLADDLAGAAEDARSAVVIAREIQSPEVIWECEMAAGDVAAGDPAGGGAAAGPGGEVAAGDPEEALRHYGAAMDALEEIRRELRLEEFKAAYLAGRIALYYKTAALLARLGRGAQALAVCERSRARAFRDLLAASPTPIRPRTDAPLAQACVLLEEKVRTLSATRARMAVSAEPDRGRLKELDREIREAKRQWEDRRAEVLLRDPEYGALAGSAPAPGPEEILKALRPDEALIEYFLGPESSLGIVARGGHIRAVPLAVGSGTLAEEISRLRQPLQAPRNLALLGFDLALAQRIRAQIFDPLAPLIEDAGRVIIVPDGALHSLPFEALPMESGPDAAGVPADGALYADFAARRFLGDGFTIEYLPASGLLVRAAAAGLQTDCPLLAMGQPVGDMPQLVHAGEELRAVAGVFPGASVAVGEEASESRFKARAGGCRRLHLSTHGAVDEDAPLYSGLHLSADPAGPEDGFLHAYEVLALKLPCELVVLSACRTGLGRLYAGEGLLGMTRAFFHAGAQRAVVSLWSVDDRSTAVLMEHFYRGLAENQDPARALQAAKRALRREWRAAAAGDRPLSYAHPYFWAPFVLIRATGER